MVGVVILFGRRLLVGYWDVFDVCNGVFGGFVVIISGCSVVELWVVILCGFVAVWVLIGLNVVVLKLGFDDLLEVV